MLDNFVPMLRNLQKQRLLKMFDHEKNPFKILILDFKSQEILSPLLKVTDLRDVGVTAHFLITNSRSQIKDVPAVYFIDSHESLNSLLNDFSKDLYGSYFLNACYSFKRTELESLASFSSEKKISRKIQSVYDQFIQFICLQDDFFTLNTSNSFLNRTNPNNLRNYSNGLFSVFFTLNQVPLIISSEATNELGKMLSDRIKSNKIIKSGVKRPLLILLDREFDLLTPIKHSMDYMELMNETLGVNLNKVMGINVDVDDDLYKNNWFLEFTGVVETLENELHSYSKELALRSLTNKSSQEEIQVAMADFPHLQRRGEFVNAHINICTKMLEIVNKRKIGDICRMEENFDKSEFNDIIKEAEKKDILRMCVVLFGLSKLPVEVVYSILQTSKIDSSVFDYFKSEIKMVDGIASRFKNFLFKKNLPIYSYIESVYNRLKAQTLHESTTESVYDPIGQGNVFVNEISQIVLFVNGGITYSELKAGKEFEKQYGIPVIIGGSEVISADELIKQIKALVSNS